MSYDGKIVFIQSGYWYYYSNNYGIKDSIKGVKSLTGMSNFAITYDGGTVYTVVSNAAGCKLLKYEIKEDVSSPNFKYVCDIADTNPFAANDDTIRIKCSPTGKIIVVSGTYPLTNGKQSILRKTFISKNVDSSPRTFSIIKHSNL